MKRVRYIHQDLLMALILLAFGVAFFIGSYYLPETDVPVNNVRAFPQFASGALIIFSIFNIFHGWKATKKLNADLENSSNIIPEISWTKLKYPVLGFLGVLIYAIGVSVVGFFVSTMVFMVAAIWLLGYRKIWVILTTTLGIELFIYLLFVKFLCTRMPKGLLF
jgi:hypothetical protein